MIGLQLARALVRLGALANRGVDPRGDLGRRCGYLTQERLRAVRVAFAQLVLDHREQRSIEPLARGFVAVPRGQRGPVAESTLAEEVEDRERPVVARRIVLEDVKEALEALLRVVRELS